MNKYMSICCHISPWDIDFWNLRPFVELRYAVKKVQIWERLKFWKVNYVPKADMSTMINVANASTTGAVSYTHLI